MCLVCGSPEAESHFGAISCRACASFFRRYFLSKKVSEKCTCTDRTVKSHPCRKCRIEKCLEVGMSVCKSNGSEILQPSTSSTCETSISLLNTRIICRSTSNLDFANFNWKEIKKMWNERRKVDGKMECMNVHEITSMTKTDIDLAWNMVNNMFPSTGMLKKSDKKAVLRNFILKFWQLVSIFDCIENEEYYANMSDEDYEKTIVSFYEGSFEKGKEMSKKDILRIFQPFWDYTVFRMAPSIVELKLRKKELMAIVFLLFFDPAYTNISAECQDMFRNIRKLILRELRSSQIDRNYEESRFIDTLETLEIIEKLEKKFVEEMMVCEMHNMRIHEDFKAILRENKI